LFLFATLKALSCLPFAGVYLHHESASFEPWPALPPCQTMCGTREKGFVIDHLTETSARMHMVDNATPLLGRWSHSVLVTGSVGPELTLESVVLTNM
jgi:hypothetical protein